MSHQHNTEQRALKWSLIIGIIVVLNLFFNYGISVVFEDEPQYDDFCTAGRISVPIETPEQCQEVGGVWEADRYPKPLEPAIDETGQTRVRPAGYCDADHTCREDFDAARDDYNRDVFIILVILGIASLVVGMTLKKSEVVATGLSYGGVLSLIIASLRYWSSADDIIKLLILAVALGVLVWLGIKKFGDQSKE